MASKRDADRKHRQRTQKATAAITATAEQMTIGVRPLWNLASISLERPNCAQHQHQNDQMSGTRKTDTTKNQSIIGAPNFQ